MLALWNKYKPTIAVDAMEYDRKLKQLLGTNLADVGTDLIIRCGNCRNCYKDAFFSDLWCIESKHKVLKEQYCGYAERRENETD